MLAQKSVLSAKNQSPMSSVQKHKIHLNMKNYRILSFLFVLFVALLAPASCKTKSGCEANESLKPKTSKNGSFKSNKKRDAGLFPKKMRKKMNK